LKVLVLGAGGQLGAELARHCKSLADDVRALSHAELDICDADRVRSVVRTSAPEVVFNAAAYTAVDRAESERELAHEVNSLAPRRLAQVCRDLAVRLVHFSTDYVFDGSARSPIVESALTAPLGVYGRTKQEGEVAVLGSGADVYLVRSSWVYGLDGANFVKTVMRVCRQKGEMRVVNDQHGSPTWARDLAWASRRLMDVGTPGIYHLTNSGDCTWYELARAVKEIAHLDCALHPITTAEYPTPARRPAYSVLANAAWQALGEPPLRHWREALTGCLAEIAV